MRQPHTSSERHPAARGRPRRCSGPARRMCSVRPAWPARHPRERSAGRSPRLAPEQREDIREMLIEIWQLDSSKASKVSKVQPSSFPAAYPRFQGYWGNQARTRGSWELGSKVPPYQKKQKSLRIWLTIFREWPNFVYKISEHRI